VSPRTDRLMVHELAEKPPSVPPTLPDIEPPEGRGYWHGGAVEERERWKRRALEAENLVDRLLRILQTWEPHT
jgi:hypothetical protein